jgi:hypothetical protein
MLPDHWFKRPMITTRYGEISRGPEKAVLLDIQQSRRSRSRAM